MLGTDEAGCLELTLYRAPHCGTVRAWGGAVGVRHFRDLIAWQLSYELKCEVFAFTATEPVSHDFRYCDQIRASSASAPSNIAEGFGRFRPLDFARFLEIARASLIETQSHLFDGRDRGYVSQALFSRLWNLAARALAATTNLMLHLKRRGVRRPKAHSP